MNSNAMHLDEIGRYLNPSFTTPAFRRQPSKNAPMVQVPPAEASSLGFVGVVGRGLLSKR